MFRQLDKVRAAQARVAAHRTELAAPAAALLARGQEHPLLMLGAAGGAGFVLGTLDASPLRIPGLDSLLRGGLAEAVAQGVRLVAELGANAADQASP
nr:hypothetical protein [Rhodanobacter sp. 7MK24]